MKSHVLQLLVFSCLSLGNGLAQDSPNSNEIAVIGTAVVSEKADQVSFTVSAEGTGANLKAAVEAARVKVGSITATLLALGFTDSDLTTSKFTEGDNPSKLLLSSKKDYRAVVEIQIRSNRPESLEETILKLSELKVDVYNLRYTLKDDFKLTQKALRQAAERATEKADLLATTLKVSISGISSAEELPLGSTSANGQVNIRGGRANETGVYMDGYQQVAFLGSGLSGGYSRTLFYEQLIYRMASVRVVFTITK